MDGQPHTILTSQDAKPEPSAACIPCCGGLLIDPTARAFVPPTPIPPNPDGADLPAHAISQNEDSEERSTSASQDVIYRINSPESLSLIYSGGIPKEVYARLRHPTCSRESHKPWGPRTRRFWVLLAVVVLLTVGFAVSVGIALGLGSKTKLSSSQKDQTSGRIIIHTSYAKPTSTSDPGYHIGGANDPMHYSTKGAFNGSGIALAEVTSNTHDYGVATIYFQHWTGQIRWIQLTEEGEWLGGSLSEVVAIDAKNSTPLSAVVLTINNTITWHVFYINRDGYLREKVNSNVTNIWVDGPINEKNLKSLNNSLVGMQACWYRSSCSSSDYSKDSKTSRVDSTVSSGTEYGMHIWYAADETTFEQYDYREGDPNGWVWQKTWRGMNGHAGVGCYSWGPGTITYIMMVNRHNGVEIWWKDTNVSLLSTDSHLVNLWSNATGGYIANVLPSTSIGYDNLLYTQMENHMIMGYNISFNAEKTNLIQEYTLVVGDSSGPIPGISGTHLAVARILEQTGYASLYVWDQIEGDDISIFVKNLRGGQWTMSKLPIPDQ